MKCKDNCVAEKTQWNDDMNTLPPEVMNIIDEITDNQDCQESALQQESDEINNSPNQIESECRSTPDGFDECITSEPMHVEEQSEQAEQCIAYDVMVERIKEQDKDRKKPKWVNLNAQEIKRLLSSTPDILLKQLTKQELRICADVIKESNADYMPDSMSSMTKLDFVNLMSQLLGNKTTLRPKKSPKKLRAILKDYVSKQFGKNVLNAIFATDSFINETLPKWRDRAVFKDGIVIGTGPSPYTWYSQPEYFQSVENHIVYMLDCHHLFVNARCFVVQNGITGLNINKDAWLDVAKNNNTSNVGLNVAMVTDVIDRQSNSIAQLTFSEAVESEMRKLGWENEANFCKCIRNWYRAEDEPWLDVTKRHEHRMAMRDMLLGSVNLASFPPPGSHIIGMPIVMFQGILTNIGRRIQLYELIPGQSYNVRAPNSLDVENLFSEFKDVDPKSTGALVADDIPVAIESACYVMQMRLNPTRQFHMHTSKRVRVYPATALQQAAHHSADVYDAESLHLNRIIMRNHAFDEKQRRRKPKRKSARIPTVDEPAIREHHRMDSSKILPLIRHGLTEI